MPKLLPHAAGLLVEREYATITELSKRPAKPYTEIIGGAKISDKIDVLHELLKHVDALLIGGAMANNFLSVLGNNMQASMVEKKSLNDAKKIMAAAKRHGVRLLLPTDVVVAKDADGKKGLRTCGVAELKPGEIALDLGPETMDAFNDVVATSKTVFWNGTLGRAEVPALANASESLAHAMISSGAKTIVGGGDTAAYVDSTNLHEHFSFVSTGGGASLELLAGKKLPGIEVLMKKQNL